MEQKTNLTKEHENELLNNFKEELINAEAIEHFTQDDDEKDFTKMFVIELSNGIQVNFEVEYTESYEHCSWGEPPYSITTSHFTSMDIWNSEDGSEIDIDDTPFRHIAIKLLNYRD